MGVSGNGVAGIQLLAKNIFRVNVDKMGLNAVLAMSKGNIQAAQDELVGRLIDLVTTLTEGSYYSGVIAIKKLRVAAMKAGWSKEAINHALDAAMEYDEQITIEGGAVHLL
jgi:hypothetical protein